MDTRSVKLMQAIEAYMEHPPPGVPDSLLEQINSTKDMLDAPLISGESPGERSAREVTEENMPPELQEQMVEESGSPVPSL